MAKNTNQEIIEFLIDGLYCDGAHHKQWYMEEAIKMMGFDLDTHYKEASEDEECGEWDKGQAP